MENKEVSYICRRCGRKLTSPEAQERGMGEVCYKKWLRKNNGKKLISVTALQFSDSTV